MDKTVKQKLPFSAWYVREFENYLSDMAKEGKRFIGRNRFKEGENKQITYHLLHGPAELDQGLLDELQAQNWVYAGDINKIGDAKTCFHAFETEDFNAPDSVFLETLVSTAKSLKNINLELLIGILLFSAITIVPIYIFWQVLPLATVIFIVYLLISGILSSWDSYAAKKYLKEMVDEFGPSYPPKDWQRLKQETRMKWITLYVVVAVVYVVYVAICIGRGKLL